MIEEQHKTIGILYKTIIIIKHPRKRQKITFKILLEKKKKDSNKKLDKKKQLFWKIRETS